METPAADALSCEATYFDGTSARPHPVRLRLTEDRLAIVGAGIHHDWSTLDLRAADAPEPLVRIGRVDSPIRIEIRDAAMAAALADRCPDLHRRARGEAGALRIVLWSLAAGAGVLLAALYGVPALATLVAPLVPSAVEARLGSAAEGQVVSLLGDALACEDPAARAVLDRLVARMVAGTPMPEAPRVGVRRHALANALTLPGARVVVLSGLLAKARTADEFAGVLAHEFGHVAVRDPTRALIAAGGTSFLLSLILGDLTGATILATLGQAAISAGYSRDAERAADAYGVAMIRRAGGDPAALATILERIDDEPEDWGAATTFLRSHPFTRERAATIRALAGPSADPRHILSDAEWDVLRALCGAAPTAAGGRAPRRR